MQATEKLTEDGALAAGNYRVWYDYQIQRIRRQAKKERPEVRATLEWSLPQLTRMANGSEPPVLPPPRALSDREARIANVDTMPVRGVLTLGGAG